MLSSFKRPYKKKQQQHGPPLDNILEEIAVIFHKSIEELKSHDKNENLVKCRKLYGYVASLITDSRPQIISAVINRERTSVIYYKRDVRDNIKTNDHLWNETWNKYVSESKIWQQYYLPDKKVA